ncbi:HD domain-containing protein [Aureivirga sp. CE67]|uniref:HD domain-containing protein n=1 Tax=Aureivirga sp. CE67 TaxID=1788983 RepID=UPI001E62A494|nr:HD domain-containing protein [Aureivirga sp. CE67]
MNENTTNKIKILNDPIYGFITIPSALIFDLIEHPYFQRLRRVSQMGMSYMIYPGAHHTRFHHAIGAMYLMQKAVRILRSKGVNISNAEAEAVQIAILLHDIGHGAFSHALEYSIVSGITHEEISIKFMESLNEQFDGKLDLAITIFKGEYSRKFLYQLISSQLDMDRLDYLKRDSFYSGVAEGAINSDRLIKMLHVKNDELVVEEKGIYSVENFLIARRLMYWQVYLHKTGVVAEKLLVSVLRRAKELAKQGVEVPASKTFRYFLYNEIDVENFDQNTLEIFSRLDDYDVLGAIKEWVYEEDFVLSTLSKMIIDRNFLKIEMQKESFPESRIEELKEKCINKFQISDSLIDYFIFAGEIGNQAYDAVYSPIKMLFKNGEVKNVTEASDQLNIQALSTKVTKHFICYPKELIN